MSNSVKSQFMFADGKKVYSKYKKEYITHKKGYVVIGPPCVGKTTYCNRQPLVKGKKAWVDSDKLFGSLGVKWHQNEKNPVDFKLNYMRADYMMEQSRALGFRVIGALFYNFIPDAIVIPDLKYHKEMMAKRKDMAKIPKWVVDCRNLLKKRGKEHKVPIFKTCEEACTYLENKKINTPTAYLL